MKIKTGRQEPAGNKGEHDDEPLTPTARLFTAPEFNCYITAVIGLKSKIKRDVFIEGLEQTLLKHPRFSSILVNDNSQEQKWVRTKVVAEDHVIIPKIELENANADAFLESYVSDLTTIPLDTSKPLWEVHLLDLKTSDAQNVVVLKIHHSVGDGMSLMSLVHACTRKTSNHEELPSLPNENRLSSKSMAGYSRLIWMVMLVWNTLCDALKFIATTMFLKDTDTPIKGDFRLSKADVFGSSYQKFPRLFNRTVDLEDIKLIKNAMKMTVNDVLLGVAQAALSEYLERRYGEKEKKAGEHESKRNSSNMLKEIRLRACLLVNIRPTTGVQDLANMMAKGSKCKWGNWIGYMLFPLSLALHDDPLEHLRRVKSIIHRKKNSLQVLLTFTSTKILIKMLGVVALTMHFQSYMNKMTIYLTVDPTAICDPHQLCDDLEESLRSIKAAVQERNATQ
ncbi:PREDICTED: O-acyltransferase WSD1-like [Brassica oleracea var. oleracea]|uniref:O-acyltransferase WSD1-like n=1 Tax=Brassica oleracea var. oleracea TaxID=109376 RepID=UPI0006A71AE6|nr:PREDICTED: O-acyltransferase WSD1-like [Brassica oleracea var. oleracea]